MSSSERADLLAPLAPPRPAAEPTTGVAPAKVQIYAATGNAGFADRIAAALDAEGFSIVNGDFEAAGGDAVIVVWSGVSIGSKAMVEAAQAPLARGALVPVSIGRVEPPDGFKHIAPVDLAGWSGETQDPRWRFVVDEIGRAAFAPKAQPAPVAAREALGKPFERAAGPAFAPPAARAPRRRAFSPALAVGLSLVGLIAFAGVSALLGDRQPDAPQVATAPAPASIMAPPPDLPDIPIAPSADLSDAAAATVIGESAVAAPILGLVAPPPAAGTEGAAGAEDKIAALIAKTIGAAPAVMTADDDADALTQPGPAIPSGYFRDCAACPEMAPIPAGAFRMGAPPDERSRKAAEGPVVDVALKPFALARREITVGDFEACVSAGACAKLLAPAGNRKTLPAVNLSWRDAQAYAAFLSATTGKRYRLPSEAEWEYAARAGAATPFAFGGALSPTRASFDASVPYGAAPGAPRRGPSAVASFAANPFGLYDMHGNVWEWTEDCWAPSHAGASADGAPRGGDCPARVLKGGAWNTGGWRLRAAHRIGKNADAREYDNGFRVARDL